MLDIVKVFPGVRALDNVSFTVEAGRDPRPRRQERGRQVNAHACADRPLHAGLRRTIRIRGTAYENLNTARAKQAGIALVAQHVKYIPGLSIAENIYCGMLPMKALGFVDWKTMNRDATRSSPASASTSTSPG